MSAWTVQDIPAQAGRRVVITGATGGLGYETALALASAGADVLLTDATGQRQVSPRRILMACPGATYAMPISISPIWPSVEAFAGRLVGEQDGLDLLVNNAGVMTPPARYETKDGFELQFGTNFLGHFALTGRLLPLLRNGRQTRVTNLSSGAHRLLAAIHFDDLQWKKSYRPWAAYAQSKLAMILFAFELQRRSDASGWGLLSNAAHPGYAITICKAAALAWAGTARLRSPSELALSSRQSWRNLPRKAPCRPSSPRRHPTRSQAAITARRICSS